MKSDYALSGSLQKSLGYAGPLPIIAVGPKGGKIVGYDAFHKPIYAGSPSYAKLVAQHEAKSGAEKIGDKVVAWLKGVLGMDAHVHGDILIVGPNNAKKITAAFGVSGASSGPGTVNFPLSQLNPFVGKPLVPEKSEQVGTAAAMAAGAFGEDAPFPESVLSSLKHVGDLGGTHGGEILKDKSGKQYAWKWNKGHTWISRAEEAVFRIGRLAMPGLFPKAEFVQHGGKPGVLVEWVDGPLLGKESDGHGVSEANIQAHFDEIVQHQIVDWLMSNHDAHGANFKISSGKLVGVDKGQAFKFIGSDELSADYQPNSSAPVYNQLWEMLASGKVEGDPVKASKPMLEALSKISPEQYAQIVEPYFTELGKMASPAAVKKARAAALDRFANLAQQWEAFLTNVTKKAVSIDLPPPPQEAVQAAPVATPEVPAPEPAATQVPAQQKPGWPQTKGNVTVHHPGSPVPAGVKWNAKFPGPGYHADVKYKGKDYVVMWGAADGKFAGSVQLPDGKLAFVTSPQNAADVMVLHNLGKPLDATATQLKEWKLGYAATKLFKVDEFDFKGAASVPEETAAEKTAQQLQAEQVITPEQQTLSLYDQLKAHPGGMLTQSALIPPEAQKWAEDLIMSGALSGKTVQVGFALKHFPLSNSTGIVGIVNGMSAGSALVSAGEVGKWEEGPSNFTMDAMHKEYPDVAQYVGSFATPTPKKPKPTAFIAPFIAPKPVVPSAWEGLKVATAKELDALAPGTFIHASVDAPGSFWQKTPSGAWKSPSGITASSHGISHHSWEVVAIPPPAPPPIGSTISFAAAPAGSKFAGKFASHIGHGKWAVLGLGVFDTKDVAGIGDMPQIPADPPPLSGAPTDAILWTMPVGSVLKFAPAAPASQGGFTYQKVGATTWVDVALDTAEDAHDLVEDWHAFEVVPHPGGSLYVSPTPPPPNSPPPPKKVGWDGYKAVSKPEMDALPVGTVLAGSGTGSTWAKKGSGLWSAVSGHLYQSSEFTYGDKFAIVPQAWAPWSGHKTLTEAELNTLPVGTVLSQESGSAKWAKQASGKWKSSITLLEVSAENLGPAAAWKLDTVPLSAKLPTPEPPKKMPPEPVIPEKPVSMKPAWTDYAFPTLEVLQGLPKGTRVRTPEGALFTKFSGAMWKRHGKGLVSQGALTMMKLGIEYQPGVPGWTGAHLPSQADLDILPVGSEVFGGKEEDKWTKIAGGGWMSTGKAPFPPVGKPLSVKVPGGATLADIPEKKKTDPPFPGWTPGPAPQIPSGAAAQGSTLWKPTATSPAAQPSMEAKSKPVEIVDPESLPEAVKGMVKSAIAEMKDTFGPGNMVKSPLHAAWVPPPGVVISGKTKGKLVYTMVQSSPVVAGVKWHVWEEDGHNLLTYALNPETALQHALEGIFPHASGSPLKIADTFPGLLESIWPSGSHHLDSAYLPSKDSVLPKDPEHVIPEEELPKPVLAKVSVAELVDLPSTKGKYGQMFFGALSETAAKKFPSGSKYLTIKGPKNAQSNVDQLTAFIKDHGLSAHTHGDVKLGYHSGAYVVIHPDALSKESPEVVTVAEAKTLAPDPPPAPQVLDPGDPNLTTTFKGLGADKKVALLGMMPDGSMLSVSTNKNAVYVKVGDTWSAVVDGVLVPGSHSQFKGESFVGYGIGVTFLTPATPGASADYASLQDAKVGDAVADDSGKIWTYAGNDEWQSGGAKLDSLFIATQNPKHLTYEKAPKSTIFSAHHSITADKLADVSVGTIVDLGFKKFVKKSPSYWEDPADTDGDLLDADYVANAAGGVSGVTLLEPGQALPGTKPSEVSGIPITASIVQKEHFGLLHDALEGTVIHLGGESWKRNTTPSYGTNLSWTKVGSEETSSSANLTNSGMAAKVASAYMNSVTVGVELPEPPVSAWPAKGKIFKKDKYHFKFSVLPLGTTLSFSDGHQIKKVGIATWLNLEDGKIVSPSSHISYYGACSVQKPKPLEGPELVAWEKAQKAKAEKEAKQKAADAKKTAAEKEAAAQKLAAAKAKAEELQKKNAEIKAWVAEHPPVKDPLLLKALSIFKKQTGTKSSFYAHTDDSGNLLTEVGKGAWKGGAASPMGELFKVPISQFLSEYGPEPDVTGPDGKAYPAGTKFVEKPLPGKTKKEQLIDLGLKAEPGADGDVVLKLPGAYELGDNTGIQKMQEILKKVGITKKGGIIRGSANTVAFFKKHEVPQLEESIPVGTEVVPEIPPQPEPFFPKGFALTTTAGQAIVDNHHSLASLPDVAHTEWGHTVMTGGKALFRPFLRTKEVLDKATGEYSWEVHGELREDPPGLKKMADGTYSLSADPNKGQFSDGLHTQQPSHKGGFKAAGAKVAKTDAGSTVQYVPATSGMGAHRAHFVVRIPHGLDPASEVAAIGEKMGLAADALVAPFDDEARNRYVQAEIVRAAKGPDAFWLDGTRDKQGSDTWLGAKLTGKMKVLASAQVVSGSSGIPRVLLSDFDDYAEKGIKCLFSTVSEDTIIHHLRAGQGIPNRAMAYFNGTKAGGMSASQDDASGGAHGVFTRVHMKGGSADPSGNVSIIYHPRVLNRTSWTAYAGDSYGDLVGGHNRTPLARDDLPSKCNSSTNEVTFHHGIDLRDVAGILCPSASKQKSLIAQYKAKSPGVEEINGLPLDQFFFLHGGGSVDADSCPGLKIGALP